VIGKSFVTDTPAGVHRDAGVVECSGAAGCVGTGAAAVQVDPMSALRFE